ncbi:MAG: DNA-directed RNA polymerase subunit alpha [Parachlamydiales bacterium]
MSSVLYGKFEIPEKIKLDSESHTPTFGRFTAEPYEKGFGHTVGNGLRRMLLSSLEAPAIVSVRMEGVLHEYMAIEGVKEDWTLVVLNLKGAKLRKLPMEGEEGGRAAKTVSKQIDVTAADLKASGGEVPITLSTLIGAGDFEVVNPDLVIFTVTGPLSRRIDLRVAYGRGYVPSERLAIGDKVADEVVIDAIFSPVSLVNYRVENTRVGQDTDFDRLILEVTTDGRITPKEAVKFAASILSRQVEVFHGVDAAELTYEKGETELNTDREEILKKLSLRIGEIELSVRSTNCLNGAGIRYIGELATMKDTDMLGFRNFGKKSLTEIREKLFEHGLQFDMALAEYGINRDNVRDLIEAYLEEKAAEALADKGEEGDEA